MPDRIIREEPTEPAATRRVTEVQDPVVEPGPGTVAARVISFVGGVIVVLLAFRFVLALLGANPSNAFANFIYTTSHPLVAPFFSLFRYNTRYGVSRVEIYTLVAMAVYAVITWGLARLVTIGSPGRTHHVT